MIKFLKKVPRSKFHEIKSLIANHNFLVISFESEECITRGLKIDTHNDMGFGQVALVNVGILDHSIRDGHENDKYYQARFVFQGTLTNIFRLYDGSYDLYHYRKSLEEIERNEEWDTAFVFTYEKMSDLEGFQFESILTDQYNIFLRHELPKGSQDFITILVNQRRFASELSRMEN